MRLFLVIFKHYAECASSSLFPLHLEGDFALALLASHFVYTLY